MHRSASVALHAAHVPPALPQLIAVLPGSHVLPLQHPLTQLVASHTQLPATQRWPPVHAEPMPQRHTPLAQLSAVVALHAVHALPPGPHAAVVSPSWHALPWQQPVGQLVPSHTQLPPTQRWPAAHGAFAPQRHAPFAHVSACVALHTRQLAPAAPQPPAVLPGWQAPSRQQPLGQLVASHTQLPATQRWPALHAGFVPHAQAPAVHRSARVGLQAAHTAPPAPHAAVVSPVWHAPFWQQPVAQFVALQPPHVPMHACGEGHIWHIVPPLPHADVLVPASHVLPWQQPLAQLAVSHTHWPPEHTWPAAQAGPLPQRHAPPAQLSAADWLHVEHTAPEVPHAIVVLPGKHTLPWQQPFAQLVASQTQLPLMQRWPAPHAGPVPQLHTPATQPSAFRPHAPHAAPAVPHVDVVFPLWHAFAWQHPVGQLVASHTHWPATQRWPATQLAPAPQRHWPIAQVSAPTPQSRHAPPVGPQAAAAVPGMHWPLMQQPDGQLVESHTHWAETHRWPAVHAAFEPQRHWPWVHESAPAPHAWQTPPPPPHCCSDVVVWHTPLRQQPLGQLPALQPEHAAFVHVCGGGQV